MLPGTLLPVPIRLMLQASVVNGLSLDPLSFCQDIGAAPEVDVGWGEIVDTLVVTAAIVVIDEGGDLGFEIAWEEVVFQQDAVLEGLEQRAIISTSTGGCSGSYGRSC